MNRRLYGPAALLALLAFTLPVHASVIFTTHEGSVTPNGLPVSAKLEVSMKPDTLVLRVSNTTPNIQVFEQTLSGVSFSIYNKKAEGDLVRGHGKVAYFGTNGLNVSSKSESANWTLAKSGDTYLLRSPGSQRTLLPESSDRGDFAGADGSLKNPGAHEFVAGTTEFEIRVPGLALTDDIINLRFHWSSTDQALLEPQISRGTAETELDKQVSSEFSTPGDIQTVPSDPPISELIPTSYSVAQIPPIGQPSEVYHGVNTGGGGFMSIAEDSPDYPDPITWAEWFEQGGLTAATGQTEPNPVPEITVPTPTVDSQTLTDLTGKTTPNDLPDIAEVSATPTPEPTTLGLLGLGVLGLLNRRRKSA